MYLFKKKRRKRVTTLTNHYRTHKEEARSLIVQKVHYWNQFYQFSFNRIAVRNQRRCWGSCSSLKNLNFNYKILFLPTHLQDYIIVHELCHLQELNHGSFFWELVEKQIPNYTVCVKELKHIEKYVLDNTHLAQVKEKYSNNVL